MDVAVAVADLPVVHSTAAEPCASLDQIASGDRVRVAGVSGDTALRRRLLEMGLCTGTEVEVIRRAPLGDPIEMRLRGYHLSLRAAQARLVAVERL